jgi:hypothetical protein
MAHEANNAAKFAFLYLLSLVSLVFVSTSVGMVIFQIINKFIEDPIHTEAFDQGVLKFAVAALIIAGPIYFLAARHINSNLEAGRLSLQSAIRRWLTYLILFIVSVVMIGWLIGMISSYMNGDLTLKFGLKALSSLAIAGIIAGYYWYDIRREKAVAKDKTVMWYGYASAALAVITLIVAIIYAGSPREARDRRADELLLGRFDVIDGAINSYYMENGKMPANLDTLVKEKRISDEKQLTDPVSGEKIAYKPGKDKLYELCATFRRGNKEEDINRYYTSRWPHDAGNQCLTQRLSALPDGKAVIPAEPIKPAPAAAPAR